MTGRMILVPRFDMIMQMQCRLAYFNVTSRAKQSKMHIAFELNGQIDPLIDPAPRTSKS